jgi:ABC-type sugar transport system permease subunit
MMRVLAGLQAIYAEQYEAAKVEGAIVGRFFPSYFAFASGVMKTAIILSIIMEF